MYIYIYTCIYIYIYVWFLHEVHLAPHLPHRAADGDFLGGRVRGWRDEHKVISVLLSLLSLSSLLSLVVVVVVVVLLIVLLLIIIMSIITTILTNISIGIQRVMMIIIIITAGRSADGDFLGGRGRVGGLFRQL